MISRLSVFFAGTCVISATVGVQAALVVNYDTDTNGTGTLRTQTASNGIDIDLDGSLDDSRRTVAFQDLGGTAWSTGASYVGPKLYGGMIAEAIDNANRGTDDYELTGFNLRYQVNTPGSGRLHTILLFEASETGLSFSTGATGTSFMQISGNDGGGIGRFENLGQVRWVVRSGGNIYVSETQVANTATGRVLDASELVSEMWSLYNPTDAFSFNFNPTFDVPTSALTSIDSFGVMTYKPTNTSVRHWFAFNEFKVDAVPEPTTLALMGLGGLAMLSRKRKP